MMNLYQYYIDMLEIAEEAFDTMVDELTRPFIEAYWENEYKLVVAKLKEERR